ncbi:hypothetical protein JCM10213_002599 [Rhodosporidiobolus nylandii]
MSDTAPLSIYRTLVHPRSLYQLTLGTALGTTLWHSFLGGPIAYKTLPRAQFGNLQAALFPKFFAIQSLSSAALLALTHRVKGLNLERVKGDKQLWALLVMLATGVGNWAVVGPWTSRVMKRRHRKERIEGHEYNDPAASDSMRALNSTFAKLHGVSSLLNLAFAVAAIGHVAHVAVTGALA